MPYQGLLNIPTIMKKTLIYTLFVLISCTAFAQKKQSKPSQKKQTKTLPAKAPPTASGNFDISSEIEEAKYMGSDEDLIGFFMKNIAFSDSAVNAQVNGTITVKYYVNETGVPIEAEIVKGLGFGIDEQVLALAPKLKYKPAQIGGTPIKMEQLISIPLRAYKKQE